MLLSIYFHNTRRTKSSHKWLCLILYVNGKVVPCKMMVSAKKIKPEYNENARLPVSIKGDDFKKVDRFHMNSS